MAKKGDWMEIIDVGKGAEPYISLFKTKQPSLRLHLTITFSMNL